MRDDSTISRTWMVNSRHVSIETMYRLVSGRLPADTLGKLWCLAGVHGALIEVPSLARLDSGLRGQLPDDLRDLLETAREQAGADHVCLHDNAGTSVFLRTFD